MGLEDREWFREGSKERAAKARARKPMGADRSDIPYYLKPQKKRGNLGKMIFGGLIWAAVILGISKFVGIQISQMRSTQPTQTQQSPENYQSANDYPAINNTVAKTTEEVFWELTNNRKQQEAHSRQADFNDNNYTPKRAENIVDTSALRELSELNQNPQVSRQVSSSKTVERTGEWVDMWGGGGKYYAEWTAINNRIDGSSVCSNHQRGSIDYRECRKGAKQYFKDQCKAWDKKYDRSGDAVSDGMKDRYCSAASSFSPMG